MKKVLSLLLAGSFLFALVCSGIKLSARGVCVSPVTKEQLQNSVSLLASFSTRYNEENRAREHNLKLACSHLTDAVLAVGGEFSFNERVGERTKENGYLDATVILCGEYVLGVGGGVCQVSSTLFCCALLAGMEITESRAHTLAVGYIPPSLDAMVSKRSDLKFRNGRGHPVYIKARAGGGSVTVEIYGMPDGRSYKTESVVLETLSPPEAEVREGECDETVREEKCGVVSESYLRVYDEKGTLISRTLIRKDSYAPIRGIVLKKTEKTSENEEKTDEND